MNALTTLVLVAGLMAPDATTPAAATPAPAPAASPSPVEPVAPAPAEPVAAPAEPAAAPVEPTAAPVEPAVTPVELPPVATGPMQGPGPAPVPPPAKKSGHDDGWWNEAKGSFYIAWSMNQTVDGSYDFAKVFSVEGLRGGVSYRVLPPLSVGLRFGYNASHEKERKTETLDNLALTATQFRALRTFPIYAQATYHIKNKSIVEPFLTVDLGTVYKYRTNDIGWFYTEDGDWQFALAPGVGIEIRTPSPTVVTLDSHFNWAAKTEDSPQEMFMTFNIGVGFYVF